MYSNKLIPELSVSCIKASKSFYIEVLGFNLEYERPEDKFAFLSKNGAQLMLEEVNEHWKTAELQRPFGRGVNFQIEISDPEKLCNSLKEKGITLFRDISVSIYSTPDGKDEQVEFLVQDPDGYLLRFCN